MTTYLEPELDFDAIDTHYADTVTLVSTDFRGDDDYTRFVAALMASRRGPLDEISQNDVRTKLLEDTVNGPRCSIEHHRYSALWSRAKAEGLIAKHGHDICTTSPSGNNGKPQVLYRWLP